MKRSWILCCLVLSLLSSSLWAQANKAEQAVAALEQTWLQSQKTNNPDLVVPLLADSMVETTADGKVIGKAQAIAMSKAMTYTSADYHDVKVTVYGDTAVATGGFAGKGADSEGKPFDSNERWTDTWVKMPNGKWQCVATHASAVKK